MVTKQPSWRLMNISNTPCTWPYHSFFAIRDLIADMPSTTAYNSILAPVLANPWSRVGPRITSCRGPVRCGSSLRAEKRWSSGSLQMREYTQKIEMCIKNNTPLFLYDVLSSSSRINVVLCHDVLFHTACIAWAKPIHSVTPLTNASSSPATAS